MINVVKNIILILLLCSEVFPHITNYKYYADLYFLNKNYGAVIKNDGTVLITKDSGNNWTTNKIQTTNNLKQVVFTSESNGWILSDYNLFATKDGGITWTQKTLLNHHMLSCMHFLNDSTGFIGGQDTLDRSMIIRTVDYGKTWTFSQIDTVFNSTIRHFDFCSDNVGVANDISTVYKTKNGGQSWSKLPIFVYSIAGGLISSKIFSEDTIITSSWYAEIVAEGYLSISNNGGKNWSHYGNGQSFHWGIKDQYFITKEIGFVSAGSNIYSTTNGGNKWDTLNVNVTKFHFVDDKNSWGINDQTIMFTKDGWKTFFSIDSLTTNIKNLTNQKSDFHLYQNFPNPFNPTTTINFSVQKSGFITLKVYDVLGREVATLINENKSVGNYSVKFNADKLVSGIYFYNMRASDFVQTKKLILLK